MCMYGCTSAGTHVCKDVVLVYVFIKDAVHGLCACVWKGAVSVYVCVRILGMCT